MPNNPLALLLTYFAAIKLIAINVNHQPIQHGQLVGRVLTRLAKGRYRFISWGGQQTMQVRWFIQRFFLLGAHPQVISTEFGARHA